MTNECEKLDAYLADNLAATEKSRFAEHLDQCESCRQTVGQQHWIDNLLRSNVRASLEPIPNALYETLPAPRAPRRHSARLIACGLATAAAVSLVAGSLTLMQSRHTRDSLEPLTNRIASQGVPEPIAEPPRATFVSNGDAIVIPLASSDDDVTIVQLYPTTETERRMRREMALQTIFSESNGG
jgi:hypothetical protein